LSLALSHRRLFSCFQRPARLGNPIFCDELKSDDGWTRKILGTLGLVINLNQTRQGIVTAGHNCHRNVEVVYGILSSTVAEETTEWSPHFDLVISFLPVNFSCPSDANDVDGTYADENSGQALNGQIVRISPSPPVIGTEIYFCGAMNKSVGRYLGTVTYHRNECYSCQFSSGTHGDSGSCVFYRSGPNSFVAFGNLTAKHETGGDLYIVTPLSPLFHSRAVSLFASQTVAIQENDTDDY